MIALVFVAAVAIGIVLGRALALVILGRPCPHPYTLQISRSRIWLSCPLCGNETPGWNLYEKRGA